MRENCGRIEKNIVYLHLNNSKVTNQPVILSEVELLWSE